MSLLYPAKAPITSRVALLALLVFTAVIPAAVHAQTDTPAMGNDLLIPRASDGATVQANIDGLCLGCSVDAQANVVSDDATAYATLRTVVGVTGTTSVSVAFPFEEPSGRYAGFAIRGDLGLLDAQLLSTITISTYSDGVFQEFATGAAALELGLLSDGDVRTVSFLTTEDFDEVRISVGALATVATETRVYYAFSAGTATPDVVDDDGISVGIGTTGDCALCLVLNPGAVVDLDLSNETIVSVPGTATGSVHLDVTFAAAQTTSVRVGFVVSSTLSDADLAAALTLQTFLNGAGVETATGTALTIRVLGDGSDRRVVEFTTTAGFDEVRFELSALPGGNGTAVEVGYAFTGTVGTAGEGVPEANSGATLSAAYPNPARESSAFTLTLAESGRVRVSVYDVLGREVSVLHDGSLPSGASSFRIERAGLPSGVYVYRASGVGTGRPFTLTHRVTLAN